MFKIQVWCKTAKEFQDVRVKYDAWGPVGFEIAAFGIFATEFNDLQAVLRDLENMRVLPHTFRGFDVVAGRGFVEDRYADPD